MGLISFGFHAQNTIDSVFISIKTGDYEKANSFIKYLESEEIKALFDFQIQYQTKGEKLNIDTAIVKDLEEKELAVYSILLADYYTSLKSPQKDSLIFNNYYEGYKGAIKLNDTVIANEALRKINSHIVYRSRDTIIYKTYLKLYENYLIDDIDRFWLFYFKIGYHFIKTEAKIETINRPELKQLFTKLKVYSKENSFHRGLYHQSLGIYQSHWLKEYSLANNNNLKALAIYDNINYWYSKSKIEGLKFNTAINYYKNEQYRKAIPFFRDDLERDKEKILVMYTNEWLSECYEATKQYDSSLYYFKQMNSVKESIDRLSHNEAIIRIEGKYNYEEKVEQLEQLSKKHKKTSNQLFTVLPVLGFITLVFMFTFYLYKRYKKKSSSLEEEQSETLQRLDELKNIVIKNHIILKDKTKIYISDLLYIKAEDHYLNIFLSNDKNHLVRGKLGQIKEELPPNFIQCHRSYIVNSNFIKQINANHIVLINKEQIPLSRSFKGKF